jgi:hypothetical protein
MDLSILRRYVGYPSAYEFGAKGNGSHDDTAAIQAGIDSGGVFLPPGNWRTTEPLVVASDQYLLGAGNQSVIEADGISGGAVVEFGDGVTIAERCGAKGFRITGTADRGIDMNLARFFSVEDVLMGGDYGLFTATDGFRTKDAYIGKLNNISTSGALVSNACFLFGSAFNAVDGSNLYTGGGNTAGLYAFLVDATDNGGANPSGGSSLKMLTAQGTQHGLYVRQAEGLSVHGLYQEQVAIPITFGDAANSKVARACSVSGVAVYPVTNSHSSYASRRAVVDFNLAYGCEVSSIDMQCSAGIGAVAPLTITGTGTGAIAIARLNVAGTIHSVQVLSGGTGYTGTPTCSAGGSGSGATFSVSVSGGAISGISVTNAGTGYFPVDLIPTLVSHRQSSRCKVSGISFWPNITGGGPAWYSPAYPWLVRHTSATDYSGVEIPDDKSWLLDAYGGSTASLRKSSNSLVHNILEYNGSGTATVTAYTPPVY